MFSFTLSVLLLLLTPGPGVLSTAGVGAAFGFGAGIRYVGGLFVGTNLVALAVVSGLATIVLASDWARYLLLFLSTLYLLYIAARIALAGSKIAFIAAARKPGIRAGILLQVINPKAYAVNTAWFSGFVLYPDSLPMETAVKFLLINLIWIPVHLLWLAAGHSLQQMDLSASTQSLINKLMALAMLLVVALAVYSVFGADAAML